MKQWSSNLAPVMYITKETERHHYLLLWQHPWFQSLSLKNQIPAFATFESKTECFALNTHGSHMVLTLANRLLEVDDPCLR